MIGKGFSSSSPEGRGRVLFSLEVRVQISDRIRGVAGRRIEQE